MLSKNSHGNISSPTKRQGLSVLPLKWGRGRADRLDTQVVAKRGCAMLEIRITLSGERRQDSVQLPPFLGRSPLEHSLHVRRKPGDMQASYAGIPAEASA